MAVDLCEPTPVDQWHNDRTDHVWKAGLQVGKQADTLRILLVLYSQEWNVEGSGRFC